MPAPSEAQRLGVPLVPVNDAADLHDVAAVPPSRFLPGRRPPGAGDASYPTVPYRLSASPAEIVSLRTASVQHTAAGWSARRSARRRQCRRATQAAGRARGGPLEGVRVVELTKVWAGPYAGKLLAFLGAEVIKVEISAIPEEMRAYGGTDINHAPFFLSINPEILSVDLDIKSPAGMAQLRDLIAAQRYRHQQPAPGAMERQGLGYDSSRDIKPDIISVSIKMWGNDGPLGYQTGYAPCFAALAGLAALVGYRGGPSARSQHALRRLHGRRGRRLRCRRRAAAPRSNRRGPVRRRVGGGNACPSMIGDCLLDTPSPDGAR